MSSIQFVPAEQLSGGIGTITPVLLPRLDKLYQQRAKRLQRLAQDHPMQDYLLFCAQIALAQQEVVQKLALPKTAIEIIQQRLGKEHPPLNWQKLERDHYWRTALGSIVEQVKSASTEQVQVVCQQLLQASVEQLENAAEHLLAQNFSQVPKGWALFIWSALSVYWAQMASTLSASAKADYGEQRQFCPVCGSAPCASVIRGGAQNGLRYLHCNLCESQWHLVRVKCSNCEGTSGLHYWSLDEKNATIKAESCDECQSYLKVIYQDKDLNLDVIADDLATLALDAGVEKEGFSRSGLNPYLLPS